MKIIDRYIVRKFLGTFFLTIALILAIAIVFDISEKIEDFLSAGASLKEIVIDYYMNFVAFYGNLFSSMIVFIATIFFTSKMTNQTEVVAILTGGVSFRRLLYPYAIGATVIAGISLLMSHFVIPRSNVTRLHFEWQYISDKTQDRYQNIHRQVKPGHFVYFENYTPERGSGYHFTYEVIKDQQLVYKLKSDFIRHDSIENTWRLDNYSLRRIRGDQESLRAGARLDTVMPFGPDEITPLMYTSEMMATPELLDFIDSERLRGSENINFHLIELHKRTSWPFATYILVLIALALCSRKTRGGLGLNMAIGLGLCVMYIFFMQISTTFATLGNFPPVLAVWVPNLLFSLIAIYLYRIAPK